MPAPSGRMPGMRHRQQPGGGRPRGGAGAEEATAQLPEARRLVMASDTLPGPAAAGMAAQSIQDRDGRPDHRHPDRRQGLALPAPDPGGAWSMPISAWPAATCARRNARCSCCTRSPAAPAGPRRRAACCCRLQPGSSGDAGAGRRRPRRLHGGRGGEPPARPLATLRPAGGADRQFRNEREADGRRATWAWRRRAGRGCRCSARRRRRWPCCAAGTVGGCC